METAKVRKRHDMYVSAKRIKKSFLSQRTVPRKIGKKGNFLSDQPPPVPTVIRRKNGTGNSGTERLHSWLLP